MLQLMDANDYIDRLEAELEETKNKTVSWVHRAERYKAERYKAFAPLIDQISFPARAIEWGILARQLEFWCGIVALIILLAAIYAVGKYLGNAAPAAVSFSLHQTIQYPPPPIPTKKRLFTKRNVFIYFYFSTRFQYPAHGRFHARDSQGLKTIGDNRSP